MDNLDEPNGGTEAAHAEDATPSVRQLGVPTKNRLRWPIIEVLRELGGSADIIDIEARVTTLLGLTAEQVAIDVPSGGKTKLQNRLGWAGHELKEHKILTYPSRGQRELTPLGNTITEAQLDDLFREEGASDSSAAAGESLESMLQRFSHETGYPTVADQEQKQLRQQWAEKLQPDNIGALSREDLSAVVNQGMWGTADYVKPKSAPTAFLSRLDSGTYESLLHTIEYLCWDRAELAERFDAVDDHGTTMGQPGQSGHIKLPGSYVSKLLSISHPGRFLPISGYGSDVGRRRMLELMELPPPEGDTFGQQSVDANDRLRDHLAAHFDDDSHTIASFLYWLVYQDPPLTDPPPDPDLAKLAEDLLIDVGFLRDIVELLEDKGQVILYGPPGTGKTYLAQELSKELALPESRRTLVQFHPSTSYEDFFEGYRPAGATDDGGIRYELTAGPLARMAERASEAPDENHVMIIDEINRGNLPRVLGELLFLLEYRDESVQTLYRPGEPFSLPANLRFIGTMNTADRSIALVDAALRRRFHFVPFFPDRYPIKGLLGRWLKENREPAWVGTLVDAVNGELKGDLEGSHLLLGPSHFMKRYGSTPDEQQERLRRIWEYNIEPFIEDQFFGDPDRIQRYRFGDVFTRHGPEDGSEGAVSLNAGTTPAAPSDAADDDAAAGTGSTGSQ